MNKDARLYGRFTLDFADSPKIAPLSDLAFRTLVEMTLHSRRMLEDGFVDERIAHRKWKKRALDELCSNDPEKPSLLKVSGGFRIHDFENHQQTRSDIERKRAAGSLGGKASSQARATADAQALSKLTTETESETESATSKEVASRARSTRIPDDWAPSAEHIAKAKELGISLAREVEAFRLHAEAHDRHAVRWNAAFSSWMMKAKPAPARPRPNDEWKRR